MLRSLTTKDVTIEMHAEPEGCPVRGNALASGNDDIDRAAEDAILERLAQGDLWVWCMVRVTVSWHIFAGHAYLGCCSYADADDFKQLGGCFDDLVDNALDELNQKIRYMYRQLRNLEEISHE